MPLRSMGPAPPSSSPRHRCAPRASPRSAASCRGRRERDRRPRAGRGWDRPTGRCARHAARSAPRCGGSTTPACTRATPDRRATTAIASRAEGDEPAQAWNRPIEAGATEPRIVKRDPDDHACPGIHGRGRGCRYDAGRAGIAQTAVVAPGRPDSATRQHDPSGRRGHNRHGREARHRAGTETRTNGRDPLPRGRAPRT